MESRLESMCVNAFHASTGRSAFFTAAPKPSLRFKCQCPALELQKIQSNRITPRLSRVPASILHAHLFEAEHPTPPGASSSENEDEDDNEEEETIIGYQSLKRESESLEGVDHVAATRLVREISSFKRNQVLSHVIPAVNRWMKGEAHPVSKNTLLYVIARLKYRNRFPHALQIANWMAFRKPVPYDTEDEIRRVELHAHCRRPASAERIFNSIPEDAKNEDAYNAILLAYTLSRLRKKAEAIFKKLKKKRMITSPYSFNLMASLYQHIEQEAKVLELQAEAKSCGIQLGLCFNNILISAMYKCQGIEAAEEIYSEIKSSNREAPHITTHIAMANSYVLEGLFERAEAVLQEIEAGLETRLFPAKRNAYNTLINMYSRTNNPAGVERMWKVLNELGRPNTFDYMTVIKSWGRLGRVEKAEKVLRVAEQAGKLTTPPIFGAIFFVYSRAGLVSRAEAMKRKMEEFGLKLDPWGYFHLIELYVKQGLINKAVETLRECQRVGKRWSKWRPLPACLSAVLGAISEAPDVELAESLVEGWKEDGYTINLAVYNKLLLVYVNAKKPAAHGFVERMRLDKVRPNEKTLALLESEKLTSETQESLA